MTLDYYCKEFNYLLNRFLSKNYPQDSVIDVKKLIELLEYFLEIDIKKEVAKNIKNNNKKVYKKVLP